MGAGGTGDVSEVSAPRHRFSRAEYERMVDAGVFEPEARLELLEGEIVEMAPQKSRHATGVTLVTETPRRVFGDGCVIRTRLPLAIDAASEPEPDIAVVRGAPRDYRDAHPERALLVVEVADTTLGYDRVRKLRAYARAGIPEYWVLDLEGEALEVYRVPSADGYGERRILAVGDSVELLRTGPGGGGQGHPALREGGAGSYRGQARDRSETRRSFTRHSLIPARDELVVIPAKPVPARPKRGAGI